ncbi:MAG TPA: sigma-54 dependent transcriptional regulator [Phycisphaerae bacterium]|nr:sigma-54 dependent transcriptional regulator [Phycisphaerae bacterium]
MHQEIVGESDSIQKLRRLVNLVGARDCSVLIQGESGTGKELVARNIHQQSNRSSKPFIVVDCAALRDTLLESQLYGHTKGAFTGAERETIGFIRAADGGTLFLDEVGELDMVAQTKLLRCIQERTVVPLGAVKPVPINVRFLAATHRNLEQMVSEERFRLDLLFRLEVVNLRVPPLRLRRDDIPILVKHFLGKIAAFYNEPIREFSPVALSIMQQYNWPGNIRELANAVEHALTVAGEEPLDVEHLPWRMRVDPHLGGDSSESNAIPSLDQAQRHLVSLALRQTSGHKGKAAELLQIERRRLYRLVRRYGL